MQRFSTDERTRVVLEGRRIVRRLVTSGDRVVHDAWEPAWKTGARAYSHSTLTHFGGVLYGRLGSQILPDEMPRVEPGEVRSAAVDLWYQWHKAEALRLIRQAYPYTKDGTAEDGRVHVLSSSLAALVGEARAKEMHEWQAWRDRRTRLIDLMACLETRGEEFGGVWLLLRVEIPANTPQWDVPRVAEEAGWAWVAEQMQQEGGEPVTANIAHQSVALYFWAEVPLSEHPPLEIDEEDSEALDREGVQDDVTLPPFRPEGR